MMERVEFYNRTTDGNLVKWVITAAQFRYILNSDLNYTQLFNYLNSIGQPEEVKEE